MAKEYGGCPVRRYVIEPHTEPQNQKLFESNDAHKNHKSLEKNEIQVAKKNQKVVSPKVNRTYNEITLEEDDGNAMLLNSGKWYKIFNQTTNEGEIKKIKI